MLIELLLIALTPASAIEAERAFARDAITEGNWTAFRKWAAPDAVVFMPEPANPHETYKDYKDPEVPIIWWPGRSYVSCDGLLAINTGPWIRDGGKRTGYFTTVWRKESDQWQWIYDAGGSTDTLRAEGGDIKAHQASCNGKQSNASSYKASSVDFIVTESNQGMSPDNTLRWTWRVSAEGSRHFIAWLWDGDNYQLIVEDVVIRKQ